jgi:Lrp/AsnC family leucine-responsive transcriptional regulator
MNQEKPDDLLLDKFDISLLGALQKNAHATNQQVGELIHLSASQVSRRIQRLETIGIIRRYVALLDPAALGLGVRAISYVTLSRHGGDEGLAFEREIAAIPEVLDCYSVAGESDYILQIVAADSGRAVGLGAAQIDPHQWRGAYSFQYCSELHQVEYGVAVGPHGADGWHFPQGARVCLIIFQNIF